MGSICITSCLDDINNRAPITSRVRATYVNLHRWPESDAEFVRSLSFRSSSSAGSGSHHRYPAQPKVVDSISCRQMYLRSYTFTRKESVNEKTRKCIGKVKEKVMVNGNKKKKKNENEKNDKKKICNEISSSSSEEKKVKSVPCAALKSLFRKLLLCSASVDVVS